MRWLGIAAALMALAPLNASMAATPKPIDTTLAFEMVSLESQMAGDKSPKAIPFPKDGMAKLAEALNAATNAAIATDPDPKTPAAALKVMEAMQAALVKLHYVQPSREDDWVETLGESFTPRQIPANDMMDAIGTSWMTRAEDSFGLKGPIYFLDCDMAALIFISVGQRMGWDIRLVEVFKHNYVHWHLPSGEVVGWDWTHQGSFPDDDYPHNRHYRHWPARDRHGKSLSFAFARSYYLTRIAYRLKDGPAKQRILEDAMRADPTNDWNYNDLAWLYAVSPSLKPSDPKSPFAYALAAWAARPLDPDVADTVACALVQADDEIDSDDGPVPVKGKRALAIAIETYARDNAADDDLRKQFAFRLALITKGEACREMP